MKNSIKIAALIVAILGANMVAKAQTSTNTASNGVIFSIGAESGLSVGKFKDAYKWNLGGSVQADIPVVSQLYATVNAGYQNYYGKDVIYGTTVSPADIQTLPVKAGLKYFPVKYLYIQGEAGAAFILNKAEAGYHNSAAFIYAPAIGAQLPVGGGSYIDAGVRYEASTQFTSGADISKTNTLGLRVAYAFGIK